MAKIVRKVKKSFDPSDKVLVVTGAGKTEQAHKAQCDINVILRDYQRTGLIRHAKENAGRYDDVTAIDFTQAMQLVTSAQNMFLSLPSDMRKRFGNDPAAFLDFVQNPENAGEMQKLGILKGNDGIDVSGALVGSPTKVDPLPEPEPPPE